MGKIYTGYNCKSCKNEMILITEEVHTTLRKGRYISCPHCGSKRVLKDKEVDNLREIMQARSYKRGPRGSIKQVR